MKYYILISFLSLLILIKVDAVFAQHQEADAVYLKMTKEFQLNDDGSVDYHYSHKLQLLTNYATSRKYGQTSIIYNPKFQKVNVNYSRTTLPDGKQIASPINAYNEVLPRFAVNAPAYNHLRRLVVTHTALENNAIVDIDYEVKTGKGFYPALMGNEVISGNSPILELDIIVKIPVSKELKYRLLNSDVGVESSIEGANKIYKWSFKNIPGIISESYSADAADFKPYLIFSTAANLEEVYRNLLKQKAFKYYTDEKMAEYVRGLRENSKNRLDFALTIQELVSKYVNTYNIPIYYSGYEIRPNKDVFYSNGGTLLEKAALMTDLISSAAIIAYPVLVSNSKLVDNEIGNINVFDEILIKMIMRDGSILYLPVNGEANHNVRYSLEGKSLIPIDTYHESLEIINEKAVENKLIINSVIDLNKDEKLDTRVTAELTGAFCPYFKMLKDTNKTVKSLLSKQSDLKNINISKLTDVSLNMNYEAKISSTIRSQDKYLFWEIPESQKGIKSWRLPVLIKQRYTPMNLPFSINEEYNFNIKLPENIILVSPEVSINKENEILKLIIEINQTKEGVSIRRNLIIKKREISLADYEKFREIMNIWLMNKYKTLIFKEKDV